MLYSNSDIPDFECKLDVCHTHTPTHRHAFPFDLQTSHLTSPKFAPARVSAAAAAAAPACVYKSCKVCKYFANDGRIMHLVFTQQTRTHKHACTHRARRPPDTTLILRPCGRALCAGRAVNSLRPKRTGCLGQIVSNAQPVGICHFGASIFAPDTATVLDGSVTCAPLHLSALSATVHTLSVPEKISFLAWCPCCCEASFRNA